MGWTGVAVLVYRVFQTLKFPVKRNETKMQSHAQQAATRSRVPRSSPCDTLLHSGE